MDGYPHELEYRREHAKGIRELAYVELVDDMGFTMEHRAELRERWAVRYATACAEDFLARQRAKPGRFVVSVYRLRPEEPRHHLITIRLTWPPPKTKKASTSA
ncbi:hypothetical protein [Amycolatopsis sp. CA-230715]|uniref:hypothetical protein n=1 Tax=Amycolatopsis sp. CA-230715 TaxID=2745196 RepID=UPI001C01EC39|nr:hypothetical protein [Amycolatopsis sp. CA-230715]QWF84287.1 hypothetical protein HUW46_07737 [Amycolatopsis sp. CA-230715]